MRNGSISPNGCEPEPFLGNFTEPVLCLQTVGGLGTALDWRLGSARRSSWGSFSKYRSVIGFREKGGNVHVTHSC